jgi:hypothetical protein
MSTDGPNLIGSLHGSEYLSKEHVLLLDTRFGFWLIGAAVYLGQILEKKSKLRI